MSLAKTGSETNFVTNWISLTYTDCEEVTADWQCSLQKTVI